MADQPAYTTVPGKVPDLMGKIRTAGVPPKATKAWLQSLGYTSSNDPSLIGVLRQIGFIDMSGVPTPAWKQYRGADHEEVLGRAITLGYDSLFAVYPDANERSNTELANVFSTQTSAGKQVVDKMVATFKGLAGIAKFDGAPLPPAAPAATTAPGAVPPAGSVATVPLGVTPSGAGVLAVNLNIQLTLPETTDEKLLDAFFKSMKAHLLSNDPS
ncbi:MAG TPA: DUF5343 domain-containing protein [Marmoricola sp.]|jgi:hypothetical protein|nr:DUF5343 domain-containing protein [Marmoricola sp.]